MPLVTIVTIYQVYATGHICYYISGLLHWSQLLLYIRFTPLVTFVTIYQVYATGHICYYISGLRHWSSEDNPWVEHARFGIDCPFVLRCKGEDFINTVRLALSMDDDEVSEKLILPHLLF